MSGRRPRLDRRRAAARCAVTPGAADGAHAHRRRPDGRGDRRAPRRLARRRAALARPGPLRRAPARRGGRRGRGRAARGRRPRRRVRIAFNAEDGPQRAPVRPLPPPPRTRAVAAGRARGPAAADPRRAGPHAPQVRRARRRRPSGRARRTGRSTPGRARRTSLVTVDARPVLAGRLRARSSTSSGTAGASRAAAPSTRADRRSRGAHRAAVVLPRARARALRTASPSASAGRAPARAHRLAGADGGADPRRAQPGAGRATRRRAGVSTPRRSRRSSAQWAPTALGLEGAAARARARRAALHRASSSTPYAPGAVHDYMHAKVTVADDVVFIGSFNLSRSGEQNAENVLEIRRRGAGRADGGLRRRDPGASRDRRPITRPA